MHPFTTVLLSVDVQDLLTIPMPDIVSSGRDANSHLNFGSTKLEMICLKYPHPGRTNVLCTVLFWMHLQVSEKIEKVTESNWLATYMEL